jgi:hypothetical protein
LRHQIAAAGADAWHRFGGKGGSMADTTPERLALTNRINRLCFAEYCPVGWFKAVTLGELRRYVQAADMGLVDRYSNAASDPALDRELIRLFLQEWLVCHHPESIGAFGLEVSEFRLITRGEAFATVDRIIAASLEYPEAIIGGCLDWLEPSSPEEAADVPYPQLGVWFAELFGGNGCRFYLHDSAGGPTVRFNLANLPVIGLAPDLVGMLWLE